MLNGLGVVTYCFMFLNRKFVHMFLNNLNFIPISMHKAKVYKKFLFLDFPVEDPEISIMLPFTFLSALILSAVRVFPRDQNSFIQMIRLKEEDHYQ